MPPTSNIGGAKNGTGDDGVMVIDGVLARVSVGGRELRRNDTAGGGMVPTVVVAAPPPVPPDVAPVPACPVPFAPP
jgi:hypothetical protein